jgi:hypothetical protein
LTATLTPAGSMLTTTCGPTRASTSSARDGACRTSGALTYPGAGNTLIASE